MKDKTPKKETIGFHVQDMDRELHRRIKSAAALSDQTIKEWVLDAIQLKLASDDLKI